MSGEDALPTNTFIRQGYPCRIKVALSLSKKRKTYKIPRGQLEQQRLHEDNVLETQRALMFILPILMVAVLAVGLYFGYQTYLHKNTHTTVTPAETADIEEQSDPMLLSVVSSASPLDAGYVPELREVDGVQVSSYAADDLQNLLKSASDNGIDVVLTEGYISFEEQKERYHNAVKSYKKSSKSSTVKAEAHVKLTIPKEGESEQQTGLLVYLRSDTDEQFSKTPAFRWLMRYGADYGFVLRYPDNENVGGLKYSPSLFRYVGRENAYHMRAYDMNFDEYVSYLSSQ